MKRISLLAILLIAFSGLYAQPQDTAGLNRIQRVPKFTLLTVPNVKLFSDSLLPKQKPLVLIFFNPDCDHCQRETKELLAYKEELKDIPIVMASALPYEEIKEFYTAYNLASMPNLVMGQDINFTLGSKYAPKRYPAIFVYDATGKLSKVFAGGGEVPAIIEATK